MVYESDFYTTRRPYSRPTVTSYSVTNRGVKLPGVGKGQTFHRNIPYIAHKKLAMVTPSAHGWRVNKSVLLGEIDRIYHKVRPSLAYQPTEDYLNSRSIVSFDDETRSIRAKTAEILKKIYTPIPRAQRPLPLTGELLQAYAKIKNLTMRLVIFPRYLDNYGAYYSHSELPITERITSDNYIDRLLSANKDVRNHVLTRSYYDEPVKRYGGIGKGNLACVSFAGGRPISRRRNLAHDNIRNDINVLSHYGRFRAAAAASVVPEPDYIPIPSHPPTISTVTGSWKSNAPLRTGSDKTQKSSYKPREFTAGAEFDAAYDRKKKRREALEAAAMREVREEKRHKEEAEMQEQLAQIAAEEEEKARRDEEERLEAERIAAAREEAERKAREEEEAAKKAEEERIRKEEEARKAKEEKERKAREEEERKAKEEEERKLREEEERKAREEAERLAREEEERKAREEAERLAREEAERKAEEERLAKEEAERLAKEEEERLAREEEERLAKEEAERLAKEAEEQESAAAGEVEEEEAEEPAAEEESPAETKEPEENPAPEEEPLVEEPTSPEPAEEETGAEENEVEEEEPEE